MANVVINPPRSRMVDNNGVVSPEWYRFFVSIQKLLGGDNGGSNPFDDNTLLGANPGAATALQQSQDDFSPPAITAPPPDDFSPPAIIPPTPDNFTPPVIPVASDDLLYPYVSPASL